MRWTLSLILAALLTLWGCDIAPTAEPSSQWTAAGLSDRDVHELTLNENMLYAATDSGMYRRPIGSGASWSEMGLQGKLVVDVARLADGRMLAGVQYDAGTDGAVLYRQTSSGTGWTAFDSGYGPQGTRTVRALAAIPGGRDTVFARGNRNVARSVDGGDEWNSVWDEWSASGYQAPLLYISPHDPSLVFAGGESTIFQPYLVRSTDSGDSWSPSSKPLGGGDNAVYSMIEHPDEPGRFLLGMEGHVLRSEDGGRSWTVAYEPTGYTYIYDFATREEGSRTIIYAAGVENGTQGGALTLHRTDDFGVTWQRIAHATGPDSTATRTLTHVSRNGAERLYLGTTDGVYVYRP